MSSHQLTDWLPTTRKEMDLRGWDVADVILFSADAYVDHPSFGAAVIGRTLEAMGLRVAIVAAEWNGHITSALTDGALKVFADEGYSAWDIDVYHVPGAVELTYAASQLIEASLYDAVIVFGCVIRGGTPHFDYVCQSVTQGVTSLNADCDIPVIFGVLTVDCEQDALDRAGGALGNNFSLFRDSLAEVVDFTRKVKDI